MSSLDANPSNGIQMMSATAGDLKRKRSPSHDLHPAPLPKTAKTHNHLQINYLARQLNNDLPLINNDDTLPNILSLLSDYQGVLDRHESMACNLGARPLGPILIKRFERLFDGPPKVLKSHGKDGTTVSWLDVVEFARNKPEQFQLGQMSEGVRVCQFYTKQCRVQISEEDYVLISSGIPQKMIPPQPIVEDEEKELGTLEILEKNLAQISQLADQVAARTRQLNHRLKGRKQAILDRRANTSPAPPIRASSPSNVALMNGAIPSNNTVIASLSQVQPQQPGFIAVNQRSQDSPNPHNGASLNTRHDLMTKFHTLNDRRTQSQPINGYDRRPPGQTYPSSHPPTPPLSNKANLKPNNVPSNLANLATGQVPMPESEPPASFPPTGPSTPVPVAIPSTPVNLLPQSHHQRTPGTAAPEKDDGGPFKTEMVHRMETIAKGERILPPCDRCRRLHMDCLKNLTACQGCTKKHAKCSWKEVRENELRGGFTMPPSTGFGHASEHSEDGDGSGLEGGSAGSPNVSAVLSPRGPALTPTAPAPEPRMAQPGRSDTPTQAGKSERDRLVEEQLKEAAASSLAHARLEQQNQREREGDTPRAEYGTLVAG